MVQAKNDEGFDDQYDTVGKQEVRNKDTSRFLAWVTRQEAYFTDKGKRGRRVLQTKKVRKREQYKNTKLSTLPGYYIENVTKIAI